MAVFVPAHTVITLDIFINWGDIIKVLKVVDRNRSITVTGQILHSCLYHY